MKIVQLELAAFGRFTHTILDFAQSPAGLHLIYGNNEAGKSTLRRALTHLLFGIPERTSDAYLHTTDQLRLGARLRNAQGDELQYYRRKGRKNTLLSKDNQPLDESCLTPFIGAINEAQFTALFCFDHERLRQGGEDLLSHGGSVGASLFQAGTGSVRLHEVLADLDREEEELFKVRGTKPKLNQTIRTYKEACQRIKESSLSASEWTEHAKALENARESHAKVSEQLHDLQVEHSQLARIQRTRPLLQRHHQLKQELMQLTDIILLPDNATTQRIEVNLALKNAKFHEKQAQQAIVKITDQLQQIIIPEDLLTHKAAIDNLRTRLGSHQKAARDLPGVRTEMRTVESEAQTLLRRIYPQLDLYEVPQLGMTQPQREKLKQLADSYPALREKQASITERLDKISQQLQQQKEYLQNLPLPADLTELKAALQHALKQGELEDLLTKESKDMRLLTVKVEIGLKQLGLWLGSLEELEQAVLPSIERIESFDRRFKEIDNDKQRIKERLIEARENYNRTTKKMNALQWAGEIPTENSLLKARQLRNQYWQTLKKTQPTVETCRIFEEAIQKADDIADRLRREAQRVTEQANLQAEQESARQEQERQSKKWHLTNELLANLQHEWEEYWRPLKMTPWPPTEMRTWLSECLNLRQQASGLREKRHQLEIRQQLVTELCQELSQALAQLPQGVISLTRLSDLIEQAQASVAEAIELQHQRDNLDQQIRMLLVEQQRLETGQQQMADALASWQAEWIKILTPLRLPVDTSPETARNVLDTLDRILNQLDKVSSLRRRVERMEEDAAVFHQEVMTISQTIDSELKYEAVDQVILSLTHRLNQAEKDLTRYEQLQQQLQVEQQRLNQAETAIQTAQLQLTTLLEQGHCTDLSALEQAEQHSVQKKLLQRQLAEVEQHLLEQGEGLSLTELAEAIATIEINEVPGRLRSCVEQIHQLEQQRSELDRTIGQQRTLLNQMDGNALAAKAADEAQLALTEMQDLSERYMQVHLAAVLLRRSIERYREQHQGPLIQRTSELFKRLTLNGFYGIKSDYQGQDDQPVLLGLRSARGPGIPTTGMSDGTRDQLYLALRLASIERYLDKNSPLPLILDDILINFDDDRAQAALAILGELSEKTQILFLTHHSRLLELAQLTLSKEQVTIHQLGDQSSELGLIG